MSGQVHANAGELTPRKRRLFAFSALIIGVFAALFVAEIALRIVGYSSPEFYMADPSRGYTLIPSMQGTYRKEGRSFVEINADGFRDIQRPLAKPPGTKRIVVIGDSYVEGFQVERHEMFVGFLQNELETCGAFAGSRIEVLPFGVSGYGTTQELLLMRESVMKYSPDLVMLVMTTNNDISDNSRYFKNTAIPYFEYRDGSLVLDDSFRSERSFVFKNSSFSRLGLWLKNHLRVVQAIGEIQVALKYRYRRWKEAPPARKTDMPGPASASPPLAEVGIDSQVYRPPADAHWENAWRVTEGIIDVMKSEAGEMGAGFVVVTASNGVQVVPDVETRALFAKTLGVTDLYYPDRRIAEFCFKRSIPVITLAPILAEYSASERVNLHGFEGNIGYGHWNQLGHRVAGTSIARQLCQGVAQ